MKNALGYVRISTTDQSNFSLEGQESYIRQYCERQGWNISSVFCDNGQSAKNFDRANWKELEKYIKSNYKNIDYLVVCKYDRFSRNVGQALGVMSDLETKYGIRVVSVMEPIALPPDSPYYFQFSTQMLLNAEVELRVIRDRTKFGMMQAAKSGRHAHTAPFGYKNVRDGSNKPALKIDEENARIVRKVYQMFIDGAPMEQIRKSLGLGMKGNSAMARMLSNPIYTGLIKVPAYHEQPETTTEGLHEAIVPRSIWWQAQAIISGKTQPKTIYREEVPLRGAVRCYCGSCLTAGNSKGRTKYYWYYKCSTRNPCSKTNLKADVLHAQFDDILKELSLPDEYLNYLRDYTASRLEETMSDETKEFEQARRDLKTVENQIDSLEGKYIRDEIDPETYHKWKSRLTNDKYALQGKIEEGTSPLSAIKDKLNTFIDKLRNLSLTYQGSSIESKHAFIKIGFNQELYYKDGMYRTTFLAPIFRLKAASLQEKGLLIFEQPAFNLERTPICAPGGSRIEPIGQLLEWFETAEVA